MYYKIGQIAKMMGVSTHLLKHYEKFGLIQPVKNEESNYRYYDISQCAKVIECKKYRNMGFSLQEIAEMTTEDSKQLSDHLEERMEALTESIRQLEFMYGITSQYERECREMDDNLNEWYIEKIPEFYFMKQSENEKILERNSCQTSDYNFIDQVPLCKSMIHMYSVFFDETKYRYEWGFYLCLNQLKLQEAKREDYVKELFTGSKYLKVNQRKVFVTYLKMDVPYVSNERLLKEVQSKYQEFHVKKVEEFFAIVVKTSIEDGCQKQYLKVFVPCEG